MFMIGTTVYNYITFSIILCYPLCKRIISSSLRPFLFLLLLLATLGKGALAQTIINNYRLYTEKDGLASNYVMNLLLDSKGYLWVGTLEGINRFDGTSFNTLVTDAKDFTSRSVECMTQVNDSTILIGTPSGLVVFNLNSNQFQNHRITDSLLKVGSTNFVHSIVTLPKGQCFISAGNYVFLLDNLLNVTKRKQITTFYKNHYFIPKQPVFLNKDSTRILIASPEIREFDLVNFKENKVAGAFSRLNQLPTLAPGSLYKTSDSTLLYSPWDWGLNYLKSGMNFPITHNSVKNPIRQVCKDPFGNRTYWLATGHGIINFNEENLRYSPAILAGADNIKTMLNVCKDLVFDKHNNLWIATEAGLVKMSSIRHAFKSFTLSFKHESLEITNAIKDTHGVVWLSTWGRNLVRVSSQGKVLRHFDEKNNGTGHLSEYLFLANDTIYAATNTGTFSYDERKQRFVTPKFYIPDSLKKGGDKIVYRDSHNNWWIGFYSRGLYRYNETSKRSNFYTLFRSPSSPEYLEMLYPTSIAEDRWGNLWMGRSSGSATFTKWDWKTDKFTTIPLHINGQTVRNFGINSLAIDSNDNVWMTTTEFGVLQYNIGKGQWTQYDKTRGLKSLYTTGLALDKAGNVWTGTYNGLSVLYRGQNNFITFSEEDGLPFTQVFWAGFPNKANTDSLLIAGTNQLAWVAVRELKRQYDTPKVSIQYVYVNNKPFFDFDRHSFHHSQANFRFSFTSINLQNGNNDIYAYRLKGAGKNWIKLGQAQEVSFNNLAPARYVFEVKARNPEGLWSAPTTYTFTIRPPYYGRWWFHLIVGCTITAILYGLYRYRISKIKALYKIRSRISRDLHDEVGSTLSGISLMNEMAKAKANGNAALNEKIADNLQKVQNSMQDIVWAVNPKNDNLDHLLLRFSQVAQEMLEPKEIAYRFDVPSEIEGLKLSMDHRREIYLIYKEWLNNIIKYANCTTVTIQFLVKGRMLHLVIADNGKGFNTTANHKGNGLKNISDRAKIVNGSLVIHSEESKGALFELKVPLF